MHWTSWHGMGWMWLFWILLAAAVVLLMRWLVFQGTTRAGDDSPETILKRRYARGDIDHEEYQRRLKQLRD